MQLRAEDISIGVTMYRRLDYLESALDSAVNQTVPVRVILYDDGCQDQAGLQRILGRFGNRVEYRRNPTTLGLFQNMNACIWNSPTPWVSVLHDDDALAKDFVERILEIAPEVTDSALFFGGTTYIDEGGKPYHRLEGATEGRWRTVTAEQYALRTWFPFPGQLMNVTEARAAGGFPTKSIYTGDWELWFRLALARGSTQLGANLAFHRVHLGIDRGTTTAAKSGRKAACCAMQVKRNLGRLRERGKTGIFDRREWLRQYRPMYRDLLVYSRKMPGWLLRYNRKLLLLTDQPGRMSRGLQWVSRVFGNPGLRLAGYARFWAERLGFKMPQTF
jgi:glycosyltransferase involved in cell wall biosynthesis